MRTTKQYISRKLNFDSGHRVMNQAYKCKSLHGHTYNTELTFEFDAASDLGYSIDFSEIKRIGVEWIMDYMDHGMILNPHDITIIEATKATNSKMWLMSLNGEGEYCNPSVENIAKEIFLAMMVLFQPYKDLRISKVIIYETPNCWTECIRESISDFEAQNWMKVNYEPIYNYTVDKGIIEYDDRKN